MWFRLMHLVMFPTQALRDAQSPPLFLPQKFQRTPTAVKVLLRYHLEHLLGQLHVPVLEIIV